MIQMLFSMLVLFLTLPAWAGPAALSFNGNISGTPSITSMFLTITSGGCDLFTTNNYGAVPIDGAGNFSVTIDGASGTYLGNASGASYSTLDNIFDTSNSNIIGSAACSVNGGIASWSVKVTVNGISLAGAVPINAVPFAVQAQTAVSVKQIAGAPISATAPSSSQVLQYTGGFWTPVTLPAGGAVNSVTATTPLISTGGANPIITLAGLGSFGTANQILGMNAGSSAYEYKTLNAGLGLSISNAPNSVTISPSGELIGLAALSGVGFVKRTGAATYAASSIALGTDVSGTLPINLGGTNSAALLNNNRVMISSGGAIVESTPLGANAPMRTNAAGLPTTGLTNLATEITGILPVISGGTGTASGSITGTGPLNFTAGGTNSNITLTPTGTGSTLLGGKVGIGTPSPSGLLHLYQTGGTTEMNLGLLGVGASEAANLNLITYAGGSSTLNSPATKGYQLQATGHNNSTPDHFSLNFYDGTTLYPLMEYSQAYGLINTPLKVSSYDSTPYLPFGSAAVPAGHHIWNANNAGPGTAALNLFSVDGTQSAYIGALGHASGNTPKIVIGQQTGTSSYSERIRIDETGKVGIGTTTPAAVLDVAGGIRGRIQYPSCGSGCSNLTLSISLANAFMVNVASGSITFSAANATAIAAAEGQEFSLTICATGGTPIPVTFNGHNGGFTTFQSWSSVSSGTCTSQKFVIMNKGGVFAFPVSQELTFTP